MTLQAVKMERTEDAAILLDPPWPRPAPHKRLYMKGTSSVCTFLREYGSRERPVWNVSDTVTTAPNDYFYDFLALQFSVNPDLRLEAVVMLSYLGAVLCWSSQNEWGGDAGAGMMSSDAQKRQQRWDRLLLETPPSRPRKVTNRSPETRSPVLTGIRLLYLMLAVMFDRDPPSISAKRRRKLASPSEPGPTEAGREGGGGAQLTQPSHAHWSPSANHDGDFYKQDSCRMRATSPTSEERTIDHPTSLNAHVSPFLLN